MATRLPNYLMRDGVTRLGQSYFNPVWADLDNRLDALERLEVDWQAQVAQLRDLGLVRIDDYIRPLTNEVDRLIAQARDETDNLAATLVSEHLLPLVAQVQELLQQAQSDTDGLAQTLVDEHIGPQLIQAQQLLSQIQQIKQTAAVETEDIAQQLVDDHIAPLLTHAEQLRGQIQQLKQAASTDADAIAQLLANAGWQDQLNTLKDEMAPLNHNHDIEDVSGLSQALAGKAPSSHSHTIEEVEGLSQKLQALTEGGTVFFDKFTSSGTWTKREGVRWIYVEAVGGGGGGGLEGGGGGGQYVSALIPASRVGSSLTVTVGAGGAPGSSEGNGGPGGSGGNSSLAGVVTAHGGVGGGGSDNHTFPGHRGYAEPFRARYIAGGTLTYDPLPDTTFGGLGQMRRYGFDTTPRVCDSVFGGGGGGVSISGSTDDRSGGVSLYAGNGGRGSYGSSNATDGQAPGGGGGGARYSQPRGRGARGEVRVWQW